MSHLNEEVPKSLIVYCSPKTKLQTNITDSEKVIIERVVSKHKHA